MVTENIVIKEVTSILKSMA